MEHKGFTKYALYRWRYIIGYVLVGILLAASLFVAGVYLPGGLSQDEMDAAVRTGSISLSSIMNGDVINLPYHALQWLSFTVFGVSTISIKIPSLILGGIAAVALVVLLRQWFTRNVSVLSAMIAVTTSQFLLFAQHGSTDILYIFWPVVVLLLATLVARRKAPTGLWKVLLCISVGLSLYTPISLYILIALGIALILHPHLRHILRRTPAWQKTIGVIIVAVVIAPLVWGIIQQPSYGLALLGVPTAMPDFVANLTALGSQYLGIRSTDGGIFMTPVFSIGSLLLVLYGLYLIIRNKSTVHGHVIISWLICLLPILIISPSLVAVLFLPTVLLLATGLSGLFSTWYKLFPKNPYARFAGLIPIVVLVSSLSLFGIARYAFTYHYDPDTVRLFSYDLKLLPEETTTLLVTEAEAPFYNTIIRFGDDMTVTTSTPNDGDYTATHDARTDAVPTAVIVNTSSQNADRFYTYN